MTLTIHIYNQETDNVETETYCEVDSWSSPHSLGSDDLFIRVSFLNGDITYIPVRSIRRLTQSTR